MAMKKLIPYITSLLLAILPGITGHGATPYTEVTGAVTIFAGGATTMSRQLYIGPAARINVIGEWRIASEQVYISPTATITGPGTIIFDDPAIYTVGTTPLSWGGQSLDGGAATIGCHVLLRNPRGAALINIPPAAILGYAADSVADMIFDGWLTFDSSTAGNNLILHQYNARFTANGRVLGYTPAHFVVTDSTGTMSKDALSSAGFIYPVGIAPLDYTPARVLNDGTPDRYSVRALAGIDPPNAEVAGMYRTWDISEATAGGSNVTLTLQHNQVAGPGGPVANDPRYDDTQAYIARSDAATSIWDSYAPSAGAMPGLLTSSTPVSNGSMLTRMGLTDFTTTTRYSKFSSVVLLGVRFVKTVHPDSVYLGDEFTYHIRLTNTGWQTLQPPLTIVDTLPAGALYLSATSPDMQVTYAGGIVTGVYNDSLPHMDSVTVDINVRAISDTVDNLAFLSGVGAVPIPTANCDTCPAGTPTAPVVLYRLIIIPNSFTPNGDGVNDNFVIPNLLHWYPNATLSVYNRNGDEVWYSNGPYHDDFAGRNYSGAVLPDGTYYYVLYYNDGSGRKSASFIDLSR